MKFFYVQKKIKEYYNKHSKDIITLKRRSRLDKKEQELCIKFIPKKSNLEIFEVGFGTGDLIKSISSNFEDAHIVGVEISEKMYDIAKKELDSADIYLSDFFSLPEKSKKEYDVLISLGVIEHYKNVKGFFEITKRLIKQNGILILSFCQSSFLGRITAFRCRRRGLPTYVHKGKKIENLLISKGFRLIKDIDLGFSQRMMVFEKS